MTCPYGGACPVETPTVRQTLPLSRPTALSTPAFVLGALALWLLASIAWRPLLLPEDAEAAVELVRAKREAAANKLIASFQDGAIQILRGKFGPYITDGAKNGRIPKDVEPESLTEADCVAILATAPAKGSGKGRFGRKGGKSEGGPKKGRAATIKAPVEKAAPKKAAAKKSTAKTSAVKKTAAKKTTVKKAAVRKKAATATKAKAPARKSA